LNALLVLSRASKGFTAASAAAGARKPGDIFAQVLSAAVIVGLLLGFHRAGYGIDYAGTSRATALAVQAPAIASRPAAPNSANGLEGERGGPVYDPWRSDRNAPYPPFFYDLYRPFAGSEAGSAASLLLNLTSIPVIAASLGASPGAALLLLLTPQQVTNAFLNNPQFIALAGLAILAWVLRRPDRRGAAMLLAGSAVLLSLKPNQFLLVPLVVARFLPRRLVVSAGLIAAGFLLLTFLRYGFWVPVWLEYGSSVEQVSGDYDNLVLLLHRAGAPQAAVWVLRLAVAAGFVAYLRRAQSSVLEALPVAAAASNLLGFHANLISTLPLLALTFAKVPLTWSATLVGLEWAYAMAFYLVARRQVFGFFGLVPLVCLALLVLARKVMPEGAGQEQPHH